MAMILNMMFLFLIFVCQLLPSPAFEAMPTSKKPAGVVKAKPAAVVPVSRKGAKVVPQVVQTRQLRHVQ